MIATQRWRLTSLQSYFMLGVMADGKLRRYERMIATQRWRLTSHENKKKKASDSTGLNGVYQKSFS